MKHCSVLVTILTLWFSIPLSGQTFENCSIKGPLFFRVEQAAQFNGSLKDFFEKELNRKNLHISGTIQLQLLIDTVGKACCMKMEDNQTGVSSYEINEAIDKMEKWTTAKQNNHVVNFAAVIKLTFTESGVQVLYVNDKPLIIKPAINPNTSNYPEIVKDRKTKNIWKLWNFNNSILPGNLSRNVSMEDNGTIWCCTDNGIVRIRDEDHWQVFSGINVPALSGKNKNTWTTGLAVDKNNHVWVKSFDYIVEYDGKQWIRYDTTNSLLKLVSHIYVDRSGIVWFCTFQGLIRYDGSHWKSFSTSNCNLASNDVRAVYLDVNDVLWVATDKGINKVSNDTWTLISKANSNLPNDQVHCIKGDKNGNIWAGVGEGEANFLVKIDSSGNISSFLSGVIWNITIDEKPDCLWLATNGKGLEFFDGKVFKSYDHWNSIIPNNTVSDVLIDKNGNKWISTFGGLVFSNLK